MSPESATARQRPVRLSKVRIESPITGIVTRRNIEEGETVVIGTMNNAGTLLLTISDLSVIQADVEVDETDSPLQLGQTAKVTIDALPGRVHGPGDRDRQLGDHAVAGSAGRPRAGDDFEVVLTLDGDRRGRPASRHGRDHDRGARRGAVDGESRCDPRRRHLDRRGPRAVGSPISRTGFRRGLRRSTCPALSRP